VSLSIGNRLLSLVGDHSAMNALADDLITVAAEQSFTFWSAQGTIYRGYARVRSGDVPEGISLLRSGSSAYRATGAELWMPYYITLLATACEIACRNHRAHRCTGGHGLAVRRPPGERLTLSEVGDNRR
jgi:predicted ATPase